MDGTDALLSAEVQTVLAVADLLSFSQAGRRLSIEQSTVSRRVRELEHRVGLVLFERTPFGIRLTEAGRLVVTRLARIRGALDDALSEARRIGSAETGVLKIGSVWTFAAGRAHALATAFRERHPGVRLVLTERGPVDLVAMMLAGDLDCALADPASLVEPSLAGESLWSERLFLAAPASASSELGGRMAMLCRTADDGPRLARRLQMALAVPGEVETHDCSRESLFALVGAGEGVTLAPQSVAAQAWKGVRFSPSPGPEAYVEFSALWRRGSENPALRRFLELARRGSR